MNNDELNSLLNDFERFLKEANTSLLNNEKHREILLRIHQYLSYMQQQPQPEDRVEKLARVISEAVVNKIPTLEIAESIEDLKQEINQLKQLLLNQSTTEIPTPAILESSPPKESTKINSLIDLLQVKSKRDIWYLGLDFGTLGIAAVLLNLNQQQQYPLYWSIKNLDGLVTQQSRYPSLIYRSTINNFLILAGEGFPQDTDIVIDNYKCYLDWVIDIESELLQNLAELLPKLLSQLYLATTPDLSDVDVKQALGQLQGIIVSFPSNWSDTYKFNLRESILKTHLVEESGEIFFLEEAIASLLGRYGDNRLTSGWTLVINGGNSTTEIALVNLPESWQNLSEHDFSLTSISYGQRALEQDIFSQFIYPIYSREIPPIDSELPTPGKVASLNRYQLDQYLQTYPFAYSFLEAARLISLMLQDQEVFNLPLGGYNCLARSQDLQEIILKPFLSNLEQLLQQLLTEKNISNREIKQVVANGGLILGIKNHLLTWLAGKFPQAQVMIDTEAENSIRVARGLAYLPLFPQVLAKSRHQYSDYFLLKELLNTLPQELFTIEELIQQLATRGINTRVCLKRLLALLQGQFPSGIIVTSFSGKKSLILSEQQGYYRTNTPLCDHLKELLAKLFSQTIQQASEPLLINLPLTNESS
ncbi:MAG: hypothetical protein EA365_14325 [Gloeocapsa sp. DLM2.Bin57]|nr:MAG: hypothetical protein EA365_14325 [Gloeocapsa sp. DLM2.Bin57]